MVNLLLIYPQKVLMLMTQMRHKECQLSHKVTVDVFRGVALGRRLFRMIGGLTEQAARLTEAVISLDQHANQNFYDKVYGELLAFENEDFNDDFLTKTFEYLTSHSLTGRKFLAKRHTARLKWLKDFHLNTR